MPPSRKRSSYGPGPKPTVPSLERARLAAEGLIGRLLSDASDEALEQLPDPENLLKVVQSARHERRDELPRDADVLDRLTIICYLEDVLKKEKLAALLDGQRGRVPLLAQSRALGKLSKQAPVVERNRLAAMFAEQQPARGGVRRGAKNGTAFIAAQRQARNLQTWVDQHKDVLEKATRRLVDTADHLRVGEYSDFFLDELHAAVEEASLVTGEWVPVAERLCAVVRHIDKERQADLPALAEEALQEARVLSQQITAATAEKP